MTNEYHNDGYEEERKRLVERIKGTGFFLAISIGDGWMPIVIELDERLATLVPEYKIHQVKEKFGTLRFYYDESDFEGDWTDPASERSYADKIVGEAEAKSATTCEYCGAPDATLSNYGYWVKTLCEPCHETRKNR